MVVVIVNDTVKNPVYEIFDIWKNQMQKAIPDIQVSYDPSATMAKDKKKYARLFMMGNPGSRWDLEGDECATAPSIQIESCAIDPKGSEKAYKIDDVSHQILTDLRFRRKNGPNLIANIDSRIKRVVSQYERLYTGQL